MTKKQKRMLMRIGGAAALFIPGMILEDSTVGIVLLLAAYALIGWDILWRAATGIRHGRVFDENFLMAVATIGALALSDYSEGVAVMLLYQIGEWFQGYAVQRSRRSISSLMDIRPDGLRQRLCLFQFAACGFARPHPTSNRQNRITTTEALDFSLFG